MKITYPEFQIDISVDEVIMLLNANLSDKDSHSNPESTPVAPASKRPKSTAKPKKKPKGNTKAVDVMIGNKWKTFGSVSQAAEAIGTKLNHLSHALLTGKTCNGHQVRYSTNGQQPEPTMEEPEDAP